jgi:hypothetical protein
MTGSGNGCASTPCQFAKKQSAPSELVPWQSTSIFGLHTGCIALTRSHQFPGRPSMDNSVPVSAY